MYIFGCIVVAGVFVMYERVRVSCVCCGVCVFYPTAHNIHYNFDTVHQIFPRILYI